jgi:hypothetical protein
LVSVLLVHIYLAGHILLDISSEGLELNARVFTGCPTVPGRLSQFLQAAAGMSTADRPLWVGLHRAA